MPRNSDGRYPLSSGQERMWFLSQLSPGSYAFNNPGALRARTTVPLDLDLLGRSVHAVARRHEIFRTTFHVHEGRPCQLVHDEIPPDYDWCDLRSMGREDREREIERRALAEGRRAFDLAEGPLLAFKVLQLDELEYVLLITSHHIVSDGWTNARLAPEIAEVYAALTRSEEPLGPPPERQYVDYVHWEREWVKGHQASQQLEYWTRQLAGDVTLALPTDRRRPAVMSHSGGLETHRLESELAFRLREFARQEKVSLFQLLHAGLAALLHRYTDQEVIILGTQTANRNRRDFQDVMGLFANTVVLRSEIDPGQSFRSHLAAVGALCQDALRNQELPFERLISELNPRRALDRSPLFQVMHVHQNVPSLYEAPEMTIEVLKIDYGTAKFDLNLWTEELDDELALTLHHVRDIFDPDTVRRWLRQYEALLRSALGDPDLAIGRLSLERDGDRSADATPVRVTGERTAHRGCFHHLFQAQVRRSPETDAVDASDGKLSYAGLNSRANRLARHLFRVGVAPGEPIALLLSRDSRSLVGALAALKTGGGYVPLDAAMPSSRLAAAMRQADARVLLTDEGLRSLAEAVEGSLLVDLDADAAKIRQNGDDDLTEIPGDEEGLAYVVFTSGTTGEPKGVCVEHRHLVAYAQAIWEVMGLERGDRFATVTPLSADLGNTMIFPALLNGGCVVVVPEELATDAVALSERFREDPADCLKIVPSHLSALLAFDGAADLLPRKLLVVGGEETTGDLIGRVRELAPNLRILNHYGPSETTVRVLTYEVPRDFDTAVDVLPLGFSLEGTQIEILDRNGRRVPLGLPGEIYVGGATVCRGYAGRPDLTEERFVSDPYRPGSRLYRTGDRGRLRDDGAVLFLGRTDRQIKIRGYRVELGEIERTLCAHPGVAEAVAVSPTAANGASGVGAYVRCITGDAPSADALRTYLASHLPKYMVPHEIRFVADIPLTENGKIDYRALPAAASERDQESGVRGAQETVGPRDRIELGLAQMWETLLEVDSVGIDDDFFALGGHSLLAVRVMAAIHEEYRCRVRLAALFEHGTVRRLADLIRMGGERTPEAPLVVIQPEGVAPPRVFAHPAGGNVLCYYELARLLGKSAPFWALQASGQVGASQDETIPALAARYLEAVLAAPRSGVPVFGGWSMGALVALEMARLYEVEMGTSATVLVLDQTAPGERPTVSIEDKDQEVERLAQFAAKVGDLVGQDLDLTPERLGASTPSERTALFLESFKAFQLAPETTRTEDFQGFLDRMLAHNRMSEAYRPEPYGGRIVLFRAEERGGASGRTEADSPDLGWSGLSTRTVEVVRVPGSHVTMIRSPQVSVLAERMSAALEPTGVPG